MALVWRKLLFIIHTIYILPIQNLTIKPRLNDGITVIIWVKFYIIYLPWLNHGLQSIRPHLDTTAYRFLDLGYRLVLADGYNNTVFLFYTKYTNDHNYIATEPFKMYFYMYVSSLQTLFVVSVQQKVFNHITLVLSMNTIILGAKQIILYYLLVLFINIVTANQR